MSLLTDRAKGAVYALCLVSFIALASYGWRMWQFRQRGVQQRDSEPEHDTGINVELTRYAPDELDAALFDIASLGFGWLRQHFSWRQIEPQPGVYNWETWDALVQAAQRHRLELVAVLDDPPIWAVRQRTFPLPCVPPYNESAYADFASQFAQRYSNSISYYQVWDEPNLGRYWGNSHVAPCGYATLLQAAYPAIHAADPTAWVLGGGLAPTQAPGPDNLNDLIYLRQLYAAGGGRWFDILAVKPYGFWSGPEDRRVASDVLNFSRLVAVREIMQAHGDNKKAAWAVEWGWNAQPANRHGEPIPWGSDTADVQSPRILDAVSRARVEWPWLGLLCWAAYQPDAPPDDAHWGFALRDSNGHPGALYDVLKQTNATGRFSPQNLASTIARIALIALFTLAAVGLVVPWFYSGWHQTAQRRWREFRSLPGGYHLGLLLALGAVYALTSLPEWMILAWFLSLPIFYAHPRWAMIGAVFGSPFFYWAKPFGVSGNWQVTPAEPFLWAAVVVFVLDIVSSAPTRQQLSFAFFDVLWIMWVVWGLISLPIAPDPVAAWREWRLCMLEPALLYGLIRHQRSHTEIPLQAWVASGVIVAIIGLGQWLTGAMVPAGSVGRVTGVYYSPNHLALYLERILPLPLTQSLHLQTQNKRQYTCILVVTAILSSGLYMTFSRGAWLLAVPAALLIIGWLARRWLWRNRWRWGIAAVGIGGLSLIWITLLNGRMASPLLQEIRIPVWQSTVEMIGDHLWRGVGLDGFQFVYPRYMHTEAWSEPLLYHPHNMWLDAAVRLGLPGLALFMLLIALNIYTTIRFFNSASASQKATGIGLVAGQVAALAHGLVDSGYFLPDLAWNLAFVAGLAFSFSKQRSSE